MTKYTGSSNIVNIPDSITAPNTNQTYKIDCISSSLFMDCKDRITEVYFPSGIDTIIGEVLKDATNLTQVVIPEGVTHIGGSAFENTPNLKSITFPDTLEVIYAYAFENSGLTSVTFPSSLKVISYMAFGGTKISTVTLPHTLENVENYAFSEFHDLRHATIRCMWMLVMMTEEDMTIISNLIMIYKNAVQDMAVGVSLNLHPDTNMISLLNVLCVSILRVILTEEMLIWTVR